MHEYGFNGTKIERLPKQAVYFTGARAVRITRLTLTVAITIN